MKSKMIIALVLLATCWTSHVLANGNTLLKQCQDGLIIADGGDLDDLMGAGQCLGAINGTIGGLAVAREAYGITVEQKLSPIICWPNKEVSKEQAMRVVVKYLKEHPQELHKGDSVLIALALMDAFPCAAS